MKEEADERAVSGNSGASRWMKQLLENIRCSCCSPTDSSIPACTTSLLKNMAAEPIGPGRQCLSLRHLFHKLLFLLLEDYRATYQLPQGNQVVMEFKKKAKSGVGIRKGRHHWTINGQTSKATSSHQDLGAA